MATTKRALSHCDTEATIGILINQRLIRKSKGKAKMLQETEAKNGGSSKQEMQLPPCRIPAKTTHHQGKGPSLVLIYPYLD